MPQCRSTASLQQVCLKMIANKIDFWCKNFSENFQVMKNFKYFIGPFDNLSSNVSNMLLDQLMEERNLQRPHLYLLMNHSLVALDLSGCPMLVKDDIINVVLSRCKTLKSINLSNCNQVKKEMLIVLAESYPDLVSLNLNGTKCAKDAAKAVFKNCTEVKELILSHCLLDDDDLWVLINSVKEKETHRNLRRFSLYSTNVTRQTLSLVLLNLPWITILEHVDLANSLNFINKKLNGDEVSQERKTIKLRSLILVDNICISSNYLKTIFKLCSQLVKIEFIQVDGYDNDCFSEMGNLKMLRDLKIVCHRYIMVDFPGLVQMLGNIGTNLQILVLEDIDGTDLLETAKLCPNVVELSLCVYDDTKSFHSDLHRLDVDYRLENIHLNKLKKLQIGGNESSDGDAEPVLTRFLSACHVVESLTLIRLNELSDTVLHNLLETNEMTQLTSLKVFACRNVTNDSLQNLILSPSNKLNSVKIMDCWKVTQQDYSNWLTTVREKNYNLNIDWN